MRMNIIISAFVLAASLAGCTKEQEWTPNFGYDDNGPGNGNISQGGTQWYEQPNPYKAPLYWNPYEYNIEDERGPNIGYIPEDEWEKNIDWMEQNLLAYGYDMICIDGWGHLSDKTYDPATGYRTTHTYQWEHGYEWWSKELRSRGMRLGIYDNPLWIYTSAADAGVKVYGTNYSIYSLVDWDDTGWFRWLQVDRPGAREYIDGFFKYYSDMGVDYIRIDFLSWFETGYDMWLGQMNRGQGREAYETALQWIRQSADRYGVFISLVMPNMYNDAEVETKYGHMVRINADAGHGTWQKFSEEWRGVHHQHWSQWSNPFDGFIYWSRISGRSKMILDGDFIRLNTFANDDEKRSVISLNLMAGGPVTVSDQYSTVGDNLKFYQNDDMLALNRDGFAGKPVSDDPHNEADSQVWYGQMRNGDWVVGLFNREGEAKWRGIEFNRMGFVKSDVTRVYDLWSKEEITFGGEDENYWAEIPPHGCKIIRISTNAANKVLRPYIGLAGGRYMNEQEVSLYSGSEGADIHYTLDGTDPTTASNKYAGPIEIAENCTLKAMAAKNGMAVSEIVTADYTIRIVKDLPEEWIRRDIGATAEPGYAEYDPDSDSFYMEGSGNDIEGTTDAFSYLYQRGTGNVTITARVDQLVKTDDWAKAGIMLRNTLDAKSANAAVLITPGNIINFQRRTAAGNRTTGTLVYEQAIPRWLRLVRTDAKVTAYYSADGVAWTQIEGEGVLTAPYVYAGAAVCSHTGEGYTSAIISNITIE